MTCFRHYNILAKTCSRMTTAMTVFLAKTKVSYPRAPVSKEKISYL